MREGERSAEREMSQDGAGSQEREALELPLTSRSLRVLTAVVTVVAGEISFTYDEVIQVRVAVPSRSCSKGPCGDPRRSNPREMWSSPPRGS